MKKKSLILSASLLMVTLCSFGASRIVHAACGSTFNVGDYYYSACTGTPETQEVDGFSIDAENNKIILKNYSGGAINYSCSASCPDNKEVEIELIGENTINVKPTDNTYPDNDSRKYAAFINIIPTFSGSGTLKIVNSIPFAFDFVDGSEGFTIELIGEDYNTGASDTTPSDLVADDGLNTPVSGGEPTKAPGSINAEKTKSDNNLSFFETTAGLIVLIAVPTVLILIIIALLFALNKKSKETVTPKAEPEITPTPEQQV